MVCPEGPNRRLTAILSADVVGYSRLMAEDEAATVRTLHDYREEIGLLVTQHRGRVVDTAGDNALAEFPTATDAVHCAVEVQGILRVRNAPLPEGRRMEFRVGIHVGEVRVEGDRIYGDGVNIAARLEALAEPGGICISGTVHDHVERKLDLRCEDLGEQSLKNIPKPVHVHRVAIGGAATDASGPTAPDAEETPAVAVLAFDNLSRDPEQEYFADGLAEDLITRLSTVGGFAVIARNSSFTYKGQAVDVKQVGRELGARYVVEGSVRRAAERVRVSAQLIDAAGGQHLWAETYDRDLSDFFDLQDEITEAIVGALPVALMRAEQQRSLRKKPGDLTAYDLLMRGVWHLQKVTPEDNLRARALFQRATERDPGCAPAFVRLVFAYHQAALMLRSEPLKQIAPQLERAARSALALDPENPGAHRAMSLHYFLRKQQAKWIGSVRRAIELNPNDSLGYAQLGMFQSVGGSPEEAIANLEKAIRLSPRDPWRFVWVSSVGWAHFAAGRSEQALEWLERSQQEKPDFNMTARAFVACYVELGRMEEAHAALAELLRLEPGLTIAQIRSDYSSLDAEFLERNFAALRKAGLPEE